MYRLYRNRALGRLRNQVQGLHSDRPRPQRQFLSTHAVLAVLLSSAHPRSCAPVVNVLLLLPHLLHLQARAVLTAALLCLCPRQACNAQQHHFRRHLPREIVINALLALNVCLQIMGRTFAVLLLWIAPLQRAPLQWTVLPALTADDSGCVTAADAS